MNSASSIDPDTIKAYLETHYCVEGGLPMTLRVSVQKPLSGRPARGCTR